MADEKNPSEMTDEELAQAVTPEPPENKEEPESPEAPEPKEKEEPEGKEGEEPNSQQEEELSPRAAKRVENLKLRELINNLKPKDEPKEVPKKGDELDYNSLDADDETRKALEADRQSYAQKRYEEGLTQSRAIQFHTRLEIDAPKVEAKFPQLDKTSDKYDSGVADAMNSHYLHLVGFDPTTGNVASDRLRYFDFVEAQFELASRLATDQVAKSTKNIAQQAATTGLRPDGSSAKRLNLNQNPADMTTEELYAAIGQTPPPTSK